MGWLTPVSHVVVPPGHSVAGFVLPHPRSDLPDVLAVPLDGQRYRIRDPVVVHFQVDVDEHVAHRSGRREPGGELGVAQRASSSPDEAAARKRANPRAGAPMRPCSHGELCAGMPSSAALSRAWMPRPAAARDSVLVPVRVADMRVA